MMMEVRSDFVVSLKLKDARGKVHTLATHSSTSVELEYSDGPSAVPHLHREAPDGHWLASYDPDDSRMYLTALAASGPQLADQRSLEIRGVPAGVRQFRWLGDGNSFVIATESQVFLAPIPERLLRPDSESVGGLFVTAQPVLVGLAAHKGAKMVDLRRAPHGFFVRTAETVDFDWSRGQVWYAQVEDAAVQQLDPIVPQGLSAYAANLAFGDELVVGVESFDSERFTDETDPLPDGQAQLWSYRISAGIEPERVRKLDCEDQCRISNWAPHSSPLVSVREWDTLEVLDPSKDTPTRWTFESESGGKVTSLWERDGQIFAADEAVLRVYDLKGKELWHWAAPGEAPIHGVHLAGGPDAGVASGVLVAVGLVVYQVQAPTGAHKAPRAERLLRTRGKFRNRQVDDGVWGGEERSFVDQALSLPGGAVAYTVVDLKNQYQEPSWEVPEQPVVFQPEANPGPTQEATIDAKVHASPPKPVPQGGGVGVQGLFELLGE